MSRLGDFADAGAHQPHLGQARVLHHSGGGPGIQASGDQAFGDLWEIEHAHHDHEGEPGTGQVVPVDITALVARRNMPTDHGVALGDSAVRDRDTGQPTARDR